MLELINNSSVLQLFLNQGYDPNVKGDNNDPILHIAAAYNINALKVLLAYSRLKPNIKNNDGLTALHSVVKGDNIDFLNHLFTGDRIYFGLTHLFEEAQTNSTIDIDKITSLMKILTLSSVDDYHLDSNVDVDKIGLLYFIATKNNIDALKLLIADDRVDPNIKSDDGMTVLHYAVIKNNIEALKLLLVDDRVDPNIKSDDGGLTALHYAVEKNNIKALKLLLTHPQINPNIQDNGGNTPCHYIAFLNDVAALKLLLAHPDINLNIKEREGFTSLYFAVDTIDILRLLVADHRVDVNTRNSWGTTAYNRARYLKNQEAMTMLSDRMSFFGKYGDSIIGTIGGGILGIALIAFCERMKSNS